MSLGPDEPRLLTMPGTLHVVATPIGNLEDITLRAIRVLREVSLIAAEDTRRTGKLLEHFGIKTSTLSYHEHNHRSRLPGLLRRLTAGDSIALVTDAGTPGVSDPGVELVDACLLAEIPVNPIPGPSAVMAAAVASGFPLSPLTCFGFPPVKGRARTEWFASLAAVPHTVCFLEAPHRVQSTLAALQVLGDRQICLARELTKAHQQILRGSLQQISSQLTVIKGEFTIVVGPATAAAGLRAGTDDGELLADIGRTAKSEEFRSKRAAAAAVARRHNRPVREVYALMMKAGHSGD
jgi:16S rRNA (cytidine1402-2'-O)-methyltransferase